MRAGRHPHLATRLAVGAVGALLLLGGLLLEITLVRATLDARATLPRFVARASSDTLDGKDAVQRHVDAGAHAEAAARMTAHAETVPTAATRTLAARAATAAGRFDEAARHATFAWRLSPSDEGLDRRAKEATTLALLGRLQPVVRILALAGFVVLTMGLLRASHRRRHRQRTAAWIGSIDTSVTVGVDGRASAKAEFATLTWDTRRVVLDVFLRPRGRPVRPPRPGPTLAVVLSHAASSLTLRLRPRRDVREDAVRIRLTNETRERLLARPGMWRIGVHLAGRRVRETKLEVAPRTPQPRTRRRRLAARA